VRRTLSLSAQQPVPDRRGISVSSGSGWIYDDSGHIVTNLHVVEDANRIDVQLSSGELRSAEIVGYDRSTDIALIRIDPGRLHPALRANARAGVQQGALVFAFGSPFDLPMYFARLAPTDPSGSTHQPRSTSSVHAPSSISKSTSSISTPQQSAIR